MIPPDAWLPVPLRWRHVVAGDTFIGNDMTLWMVKDARPHGGHIAVQTYSGDRYYPADVDPDDVIHVLIPVIERDAVELTRDQLGARLVERRTAAPQQT